MMNLFKGKFLFHTSRFFLVLSIITTGNNYITLTKIITEKWRLADGKRREKPDDQRALKMNEQ